MLSTSNKYVFECIQIFSIIRIMMLRAHTHTHAWTYNNTIYMETQKKGKFGE